MVRSRLRARRDISRFALRCVALPVCRLAAYARARVTLGAASYKYIVCARRHASRSHNKRDGGIARHRSRASTDAAHRTRCAPPHRAPRLFRRVNIWHHRLLGTRTQNTQHHIDMARTSSFKHGSSRRAVCVAWTRFAICHGEHNAR